MKLLIGLIFITSAAFAQVKEPVVMCSDGIVTLSLLKVPCKKDLLISTDFEIPELKLNFDDLGKIFTDNTDALLGSESSGGRTISPSSTPAQPEELSIPAEYKCSAKLVLDGGKTINYLLKQNFNLHYQAPVIFMGMNSWKSFLYSKSNPSVLIPSALPEGFQIPNYSLTVSDKKEGEVLKIKLCVSTTLEDKVLENCNMKSQKQSKSKFTLKLSQNETTLDTEFKISKSIKVTCNKL